MSRSSGFESDCLVTPGQSVVTIISTPQLTGVAVDLIREIATPIPNPGRTKRSFSGQWADQDGVQVLEGKVTYGGQDFRLVLKIGTSEGLVLKSGPGMRFSLKPVNGNTTIHVGGTSAHDSAWLKSKAAMLVACWVVHGRGYKDRKGELIKNPYGR